MSSYRIFYRAIKQGDVSVLYNLRATKSKEEMFAMASAKSSGRTPLCEACEKKHQDIIEYLLEKCYVDIEQTSQIIISGEQVDVTPLQLAVSKGHLDIVKILLSYGAKVNGNGNPRTPLLTACIMGNSNMVEFLIKQGADIEATDSDGATCLIIACRRGDIALVKRCLSAKANVNRTLTMDGNTALHECCWSFPPANFEIFMLLLKHGASLNIVNSDGTCPVLYAAVKHQHSLVINLIEVPNLLSHQQKIDALEVLGASSIFFDGHLTMAEYYWRRALKKRDRRNCPKESTRQICSIYGNSTEFRDTADLDALAGNLNEMGIQALHILERLLGPVHPFTTSFILYKGYRRGQNLSHCLNYYHYALDKHQETPLHPGMKTILRAFKELFTSRDTNIVAGDELLKVFSRAVQYLAMSKKYLDETPSSADRDILIQELTRIVEVTLDLISLLIKMTVSIVDENFTNQMHNTLYIFLKLELRCNFGRTPLHLSCCSNQYTANLPSISLTKLLLKLGADPNSQDEFGNTPLHFAAMLRPLQPDLLDSIIDGGAHIDVTNRSGKTIKCLIPNKSDYRRKLFNFTRLSCLSADVIRRNKIRYKGVVPIQLENIVSLH